MKISHVTNEAVMFTAKFYAAKVMNVEPQDCYFVWFSKTLQNFKAMISTDNANGKYVEVTYNGDKDELYVDLYEKGSNSAFAKPFIGSGVEGQNDKD